MSAGPRTVTVDVVSDTVCPWCFVGKRRLEKAIKQLDPAKVKVQLRWLPFFLNPDAPKPSQNKLAMYRAKFGEARVKAMLPQMIATGEQEGIKFSFGGNTGKTLDSHRLLEYALEKYGIDKQNELVEKLFSYYFEQEKDIVDVDTLVKASEEVGMTGAREFLESDELTSAVKKNVEANYQRGVTGVPFFILDGKYSVSGAQNPEAFLDLFRRIGVH